ncbi:MAG: (deoxy)nucleoside triphosphate pyrophosphohydrolase [Ignavibacteriaceae bacterium]|nr:(deoxy)nucleoside triphosphate pyrophosphohydrolase [Ignavibacteriaceae bacterium]
MNFIDVCCAIIIKNGKIFAAQKQENSKNPNKWEFPGGKKEINESLENCIKREILEELEIVIENLIPLKPISHEYEHIKINLIPFVCESKENTFKLHCHKEGGYFTLEELNNLELSEADRKLYELNIKNIYDILASGGIGKVI